jgi:3-hydroxyacyl-[acyl-carrier-protein] dehydratase
LQTGGVVGVRFLFCDRIIQIHKGESIEGTKAFSLTEEFLNGHFEVLPLVPGTIFIETMAQFLGWLIIYSHDFNCLPIISLMDDIEVMPNMVPGFEAQVQAHIESTSGTDSLGQAEIRVDGEIVARADRMIYRHFAVPDTMSLQTQFNLMVRPSGSPGPSWKPHE